MLAARSPMLREIFNECIAQGSLNPGDSFGSTGFTRLTASDEGATPMELEDSGDDAYSTESSDSGDDSTSRDSVRWLLELTLTLPVCVANLFDDVLQWIYTNNCHQWRQTFTTENYETILLAIETFILFKKDVFLICKEFEKSTDPTLGLIGLADELFRRKVADLFIDEEGQLFRPDDDQLFSGEGATLSKR
ncbi:hypothetical protein BGZ47_002338 [Haplosporangium gracile]|nr:hypothetical protein BGZ47_002338 [Haplosporangium gracile]